MTPGAATFAEGFVPRWLDLVRDEVKGGVAERIGPDGHVDWHAPRTTLTQARIAFSLAALVRDGGARGLVEDAISAWRFLDTHLRHPDGGYRRAVRVDGRPLPDGAGDRRLAYDQSFALMAIVTLDAAAPGIVPAGRVNALLAFIERLTERRTGALWQDDRGAASGLMRGQNPQMHMLEAMLQAHEVTGDAAWLERAARLVDVARRHFVDPETGAIREWVGPDLRHADGPDGARRETGHQFEWAWLLHRYAGFTGDAAARAMADRMVAFALAHGLRPDGPLAGAPFDALEPDGAVREASHLLWPVTEAGKYWAAQYRNTGADDAARHAQTCEQIVFGRFFGVHGSRAPWCNQLDAAGTPLQADAPSRLIYHVAIFVIEGARAGLWPLVPRAGKEQIIRQEETT